MDENLNFAFGENETSDNILHVQSSVPTPRSIFNSDIQYKLLT